MKLTKSLSVANEGSGQTLLLVGFNGKYICDDTDVLWLHLHLVKLVESLTLLIASYCFSMDLWLSASASIIAQSKF